MTMILQSQGECQMRGEDGWVGGLVELVAAKMKQFWQLAVLCWKCSIVSDSCQIAGMSLLCCRPSAAAAHSGDVGLRPHVACLVRPTHSPLTSPQPFFSSFFSLRQNAKCLVCLCSLCPLCPPRYTKPVHTCSAQDAAAPPPTHEVV